MKLFTIKVTNLTDNRVDIHKDLTQWDVDYIRSSSNLRVEIIEITPGYRKRGNR